MLEVAEGEEALALGRQPRELGRERRRLPAAEAAGGGGVRAWSAASGAAAVGAARGGGSDEKWTEPRKSSSVARSHALRWGA